MKLICVFVFDYAKCWFSHDVAHIKVGSKGVFITRTCYHDGKYLGAATADRKEGLQFQIELLVRLHLAA